MNKVEAIEREVRSLSPEELATFRAWFLEFDADAWDRQIEEDGRAGKLDTLAEKAIEAYRAGKASPL
jgi:hypothetical protein